MRLLIIDDEPSLLFAMNDYLTREGFEVDCALELEEAQALLSNLSFEVVLTDVRLSAMRQADGLLVVPFLRQRGVMTPVVVMTGHATPDIVAEAERLGAALVLRKPVSLPALATTLRSLGEVSS
jgi:DNA-binding NtrC family response regulator